MSLNMGHLDRLLRGLVVTPLAIVVAYLAGFGSLAGIVLLVVAAVMALTAAVGSCPLYRLVGVSTCKRRVA
ncbi:MAG: DUF2892 domain-containing protein [Gaiellales bacterium]